MNFRFSVVETSLNRAGSRWKWLRFLQQSAILGMILCAATLGLGGAILLGWLISKPLAVLLLVLLGTIGFVAWTVVVISVAAGSPDRSWLAAAVERADRRFLDRLNTLLFLERHRGQGRSGAFAIQIAKQTQRVLAEKTPPSPFSPGRPLAYVGVFSVMLASTFILNEMFLPWNRLQVSQKTAKAESPQPDKSLELAPPATNNVEQNLGWGEVRITDPGGDLKVTKVDVVPLQIEAAANQPLKNVGWFSAINGADETPHDLPPPPEPRYAVYQPTVYLDELQLSDWDVMTYYAKALTQTPAAGGDSASSTANPKENSFASEVYFLEVRPFREDILKMPGGEGGEAYQRINEMTSLINRQQHVIRQTHQHIQQPPTQPNLEAQDRKKLSSAETDLSESVEHLYAEMAAMENKPIGEALDNLAKAEKSLTGASHSLDDNLMPDAQNRERSALTELVAARKMFQKAVSDNPEAFNGKSQQDDEPPPPVADQSKKLSEMAEFRNEARAAQDFVKKTLEQQKRLEQQARSPQRNDYSKLAMQEQQLKQSLQDFQQQHPQPFKNTQSESRQASDALSKAADALQRKSSDSRSATQEASKQLDQLSQAMQGQAAGQQLADAYRLKQMLDQEIRQFDQAAKQQGEPPKDDLQRTASQARETIEQLKKAAEQEPTRDSFGQPLRDALSGQNKMDLDMKLARLDRARTLDQAQDSSTQQRAGDASQALSKVSKAFDQSQPPSLQAAHKSDSLKPNESDSFGQGVAQLESLRKQLEDQRPIKPEDQAKQTREAVANLQSGMRSQAGDEGQKQVILQQLDKISKDEKPVDIGDLKKLLESLQHFSVENSERLAKKDDGPEMTNIDPSRLPPAYRGRIQKYFQKLSEK
jgi:hypothetical protein